jgi:geranylgeranyl reductase family protein
MLTAERLSATQALADPAERLALDVTHSGGVGEQRWDLVVVGAGPAGSATALSALRASPGLRVLLLDRAGFPRDKACGDGVAPHVLDVLAEVGVSGLLDDRVPVRRLELRARDADVSRDMARPGWVVPRSVLDARLVDAAVAAGACLRRQRVRTLEMTEDGVRLGGVTARVVVGADGAYSTVRAATGLAPGPRRAVAIRGYAPVPAERRGAQVIVFADRRQPAYAWSFDRGDGLANVGYGELRGAGDSAAPPTRAMFLSAVDELLPGSTAGATSWRASHLPLSSWRWRQPDGRVLLVGDAAGLVNPVTGEGIYYAVATGVLAGRAAAAAMAAGDEAGAGRRHRRAVRGLLGTHLRHTAAASGLVSVPAVVHAGLRAAASDQGVFDDLVELGLGRGRLRARTVRGLVAAARRT